MQDLISPTFCMHKNPAVGEKDDFLVLTCKFEKVHALILHFLEKTHWKLFTMGNTVHQWTWSRHGEFLCQGCLYCTIKVLPVGRDIAGLPAMGSAAEETRAEHKAEALALCWLPAVLALERRTQNLDAPISPASPSKKPALLPGLNNMPFWDREGQKSGCLVKSVPSLANARQILMERDCL